jgi:hypothetical protein
MKIPAPVLQFGLNMALRNAGSVIAKPLENIPHIDVIAKAYNQGEPLEVIVGLYFQATKSVADDEIAGKVAEVIEFLRTGVPKILEQLSVSPAKDVIRDLIGGVVVPDFDDIPGNEKPIIDIIDDTFKALGK